MTDRKLLYQHRRRSSPELEDGQKLSDSPVSRPTRPYGQDPALASRSARQAKEQGLLTSGTSGPHSTTSSSSASLTACMASKLQAALVETGSPLYKLTWKHWDLLSGLRICALRASGRRTFDNGFTGWPTAAASSGQDDGVEYANSTGPQSGHETAEATGGGHATTPHYVDWSDADWLYCRDGKFRPAQPGTLPLVDGLPRGVVPSGDISLPSAEARVMRLRGYGNAIVPQVAAEFIKYAQQEGDQ